jgi:hypothetical protein
MRWAYAGGEAEGMGFKASLIVDGIHRVGGVLELAENGLLNEIPFIEAWACAGGCLGGPLTAQNPSLACYHLKTWMQKLNLPERGKRAEAGSVRDRFMQREDPLLPRLGMRLDENLKIAMEKLHQIDQIVKKFPGIDCGSCGCPTCLALAEDIVQGFASETDCFYVLRKGKNFST